MKLESYGPDWYYITIDIGKLVISIMCITKSIDKYLQEFQNFHDLYFSNKPNILQIVTLN